MVTSPGIGTLTGKTIIKRMVAGELPPYLYYIDVFRDHGYQPPVIQLTMPYAQYLAALPGFQEA